MTLFLRNSKNETIGDIELWKESDESGEYIEISSSIDIILYSMLLLNVPEEKRILLMTDFNCLSSIKTWMWEYYFVHNKNTHDEFRNVLEELRKILDDIGDKYGLHRVED